MIRFIDIYILTHIPRSGKREREMPRMSKRNGQIPAHTKQDKNVYKYYEKIWSVSFDNFNRETTTTNGR